MAALRELTRPALDIDALEAEAVHLYCCDENTALCGVDLANGQPRPSEEANCPMCMDECDSDRPCPAANCPLRAVAR